jgi:hypothetical protein
MRSLAARGWLGAEDLARVEMKSESGGEGTRRGLVRARVTSSWSDASTSRGRFARVPRPSFLSGFLTISRALAVDSIWTIARFYHLTTPSK